VYIHACILWLLEEADLLLQHPVYHRLQWPQQVLVPIQWRTCPCLWDPKWTLLFAANDGVLEEEAPALLAPAADVVVPTQ
jgi:hypothetical protein